MKTIHYLTLIGIAMACVFSCKTDENEALFKKLTKTNNGILRGFETGEEYNEVLSEEKNYTHIEKGNDYLYYDFDLGNEESYTLTYNFYQNKLYEITLDLYLNKSADAKEIFNQFKKHFSDKFGEFQVAKDGYTVWTTTNALSHKVEIAIKENSDSYGFFTITINDLDY